MTIPQAFDLAVHHHQAGRLAGAEALYRQILAVQPNHAEALRLLGGIAQQAGRHDLAVDLIRQAIVLHPKNPAAHFDAGQAYHNLGRMDEATAANRRAIELQPNFPEAHHNLSVGLRLRGQLHEAIASCRRAIELKPNFPEALNNLGATLAGLGQFDEAIAAYRRAIELRPNFPEALNNLGVALMARRQFDEAVAACRRAIEFKPDFSEALNNLGNALRDQGQLDEAIAAYCRALQISPNFAEIHNNLGAVLRRRGRVDEAIAACRRALDLKPNYPEAHNNLGNALQDRCEFHEAAAACRRALELKPDFPEAHNNLGNALRDQGQLDEAVAAYRRALELHPGMTSARNNMGGALKDLGEIEAAIQAYRRALKSEDDDPAIHSNLIYTLHFRPSHGKRTITEQHRRWNRRFSDPLKRFILPHANDRRLSRRLRIGYVSADLRDHPVGRFVLPLLERHDRERFEILCYSGVARSDWVTERLHAQTGKWRNTVGASDARLAEMIREDEVDILVDLALHTAGNRLPMFARQPAPVQVTWLGYPGSTGLPGIAYRLTDAHMDPLGSCSRRTACSAEEPVRLPDCWCCYDPADDCPEIHALPALSAEGVTFGSLNNFAKVNEGVLALWARVLKAVKGSRLLMFCPEGRARERVRGIFAKLGIAAERVELVGFVPRWEYLSLYQRIDIALDPFPCNGMTTTCDALWMGAPVLTLPGAIPVSRAGLSLLSTIGLDELAANSEEGYVRIAVALARDLPRLADLRSTLRPRMLASPLMDAPRFARNVEAAYQSMWERWRPGRASIR